MTGETTTRPGLHEILGILAPHRQRWIASLVLSIVQVSLYIQFPLILQSLVGAVVAGSLETLLTSFTWLLVVFGFHTIVMYVRLYKCNQYMANHVIYSMRNALMAKILSQSHAFVDMEQSGDLVSVITTDVNMLKQFLAFHVTYFTRNVLQLGGLVVIMWVINPLLLASLAFIFPLLAGIMLIYYRRIHPMTLDQREVFGDLTARLQESISGIKLVRAFANEDVEFEQFNALNQRFSDISRQAGKLSSVYNPVIRLLINLGWATVLGVGGFLVLHAVPGFTMSLDQLFAFIPAMNLLIEPVQFITWMAGEFGRIQAAYERVRRVMQGEQRVVERPGALLIPPLRGDITFDHVTFSFTPGRHVLEDITFHVPAGTTIALLGATGSGKSTLVNLLARFYDVDSGAIILDGQWNVKDVSLASYRSQLGIVAQEPFLFQQSIKDNLVHGLDGVDMQAIADACKVAGIHEFIASLPDGYDTIIGERGTTVSGGQKQRLTLARAIVRKPRILILDDATSSVDVDTEYEILDAMKRVFTTCTTILITQRLSTVRNADMIYVLDKGRIAEHGTHVELMGTRGIYAMLYDTITRNPVRPRAGPVVGGGGA